MRTAPWAGLLATCQWAQPNRRGAAFRCLSARALRGPLRPITGTLTLNKLSIESGNIFVTEPGLTIDDVLKYGALSADITGEEPIDMVLHNSYPNVSPSG